MEEKTHDHLNWYGKAGDKIQDTFLIKKKYDKLETEKETSSTK